MIMEDKLKELMDANKPENRTRIALEEKAKGRKIVGFMHATVPEEMLYAAGIFPYRLCGTQTEDVAKALYWRPGNYDRFCNHVLQAILEGQLDFLDGVVIPHHDDDTSRMWDVLDHIKFKPFNYFLYVPMKHDDLNVEYFVYGLQKFARAIVNFTRIRIRDERLRQAIAVYNKWRDLLGKLYELRKRDEPPVSGAECLAITTASFVMPKDRFNEKLEALLPYLETRKTQLKSYKPRLIVSSDALDNPAFIELAESVGCLVAMDDLDTGSRYFTMKVDETEGKPSIRALAERYLRRPGDPRMFDWARYTRQLLEWIKEYRVDGVLHLPYADAAWRLCMRPYIQDTLTANNIPWVTFVRDYHLANVEQLRTRIGAFVESLAAG